MASAEIRVVIADDHAIVRDGLRRILNDTSDLRVVAEAGNGDDVLRLLREQAFDILVLDISMPGRSGLDLLKHIKATNPELPVLMLSMFPEEQYAVRVMRAGAAGYLTKESAPDQLIAAIREVVQGRKYASPALVERLVGEIKGRATELPHELLSDREFTVFVMIATGSTLTEIAAALHVSIKTVSTHRARILAKMKLRNNIELSRYAVRHGLIS